MEDTCETRVTSAAAFALEGPTRFILRSSRISISTNQIFPSSFFFGSKFPSFFSSRSRPFTTPHILSLYFFHSPFLLILHSYSPKICWLEKVTQPLDTALNHLQEIYYSYKKCSFHISFKSNIITDISLIRAWRSYILLPI